MRDLSSVFSNSLIIVMVVNYKFNANRDRDYPSSTWTWIGHYLSFCTRVTKIHFGFGPPTQYFFVWVFSFIKLMISPVFKFSVYYISTQVLWRCLKRSYSYWSDIKPPNHIFWFFMVFVYVYHGYYLWNIT